MSQRLATKRHVDYRVPAEDEGLKNLAHVVQDAALYILAHEKRNAMTKEAELKKLLDITSQRELLELCRDLGKHFKDIFGMTLVRSNHNIFLVSPNMPRSSVAYLVEDKNGPKTAFLTTLLTVIFMEENNLPYIPMTEKRLEETLEKLGASPTVYNPVLGDVSKLIGLRGEFVKNGWLSCIKGDVPGHDDQMYVYYWGSRALASIDAVKILKWHCEVDGSNPEDWERHANKAKTLREDMKKYQKPEWY